MKYFTLLLFILTWFTANSQDTLVLQPGPEEGQDVIINTYIPDEGRPDYELFRSMAWTHSGTPASHRGLIQWDLSVLSPESTILDARLDLYFATWQPNYESHTGVNESYLLRITEPWAADVVTWNTQPATTMEDAIILPTSTSPYQDYTDIDVTSQVQAMVSDPQNNNGFMLRLITEEYYRCMLFASSNYPEPAKRPRLRIVYIGCTVPEVDFDYQAIGQTVNFSALAPSATSWHWEFGDGDTSDIPNPVHTFELPGIYQVCLTVQDSCFSNQECKEIEICITAPMAGYTYELVEQTAFFENITDFASDFYWDFGDGYFSNLQDPYHIFDENGLYQVCLFATNNCGSDTSCQWLEICAPPLSSFDFQLDGNAAYFTNYSKDATQYLWDFGDGYFSDLENPWHEYEYPGIFQVCLETWNECGIDTACQTLSISYVNVDELSDQDFIVYPNPARDEFHIKSNFQGPVEIRLQDMNGKLAFDQTMEMNEGQNIRIILNDIAPGIYILRMDCRSKSYFKKLVVLK